MPRRRTDKLPIMTAQVPEPVAAYIRAMADDNGWTLSHVLRDWIINPWYEREIAAKAGEPND